MNKEAPKVSVLMTIYNHQDFLNQSINSILKQNYQNWELIACENGSQDNSAKILHNYTDERIKKFFFDENIGRTKCLNFALKQAKGDFVAILDSDDFAYPDRLSAQLKLLMKRTDVALVGSWYSRIDKDNRRVKEVNHNITNNFFRRNMLFFNPIGHSTIMFRMSLIKEIGLYPEDFKFMQDYAFFLKVYKDFKAEILPLNLTDCRTHHTNSETTRVAKSTIIEEEWLKLLFWIKKNFKLSLVEIGNYYLVNLKLRFKIFRKKI